MKLRLCVLLLFFQIFSPNFTYARRARRKQTEAPITNFTGTLWTWGTLWSLLNSTGTPWIDLTTESTDLPETTTVKDIELVLKNAKIIPDVIYKKPPGVLYATYYHFSWSFGQIFDQTDVNEAPHHCWWVSEENAYYTLMMINVTSMYINISVDLAIECVEERWDEIERFCSIFIDQFVHMLLVCVSSTIFQFEDNYYRQILGLAMGGCVSAVLANIAMRRFELCVLNTIPFLVYFYKRYVDDLFLVVRKDNVDSVFDFFNSQSTNLQFTLEREANNELNYLDMKLVREWGEFFVNGIRRKHREGPDFPGEHDHSLAQYQHWLVVNIPGIWIAGGETLAAYVGAEPYGIGRHRFVIMVFKQPGKEKIKFNEELVYTKKDVFNRGNFSTLAFARKYGMGEPLAINFCVLDMDLLPTPYY